MNSSDFGQQPASNRSIPRRQEVDISITQNIMPLLLRVVNINPSPMAPSADESKQHQQQTLNFASCFFFRAQFKE